VTPEGFVLDASIAVAWAFDDEAGQRADAVAELLVDAFALVPSLWHVELANALAIGLKRGRIDADGIAAFMASISTFDIRTDTVTPHAGRLAVAAAAHGLSAYDASYLVLAEDRALPLATGERALAQAAKAAGVSLLTAP
jgi:predicted nucleic acid-binding protein